MITKGLSVDDEIVRGPFLVVSKTLDDGDRIEQKEEKNDKKED
jgi:hypothetical protein